MTTDSITSFLFNHKSVMSQEIISSIDNCPQKVSNHFVGIDLTLGGGGHSYQLLKKFPTLKIIGIDQDPYAIEAAKENLKEFQHRIQIEPVNFKNYKPTERVAFIIGDLGVNSSQIDNPRRGFSFNKDGPIDMRMNPSSNLEAKNIIEDLEEKELANLIYKYGDERFSRRIARKIKTDLREKGEYTGTKELAYSIAGCYPKKQRYGKIHPATRTFQALRIAVNKEIEVLENLLEVSPNWLLSGGIISLISFHSIEDRLIKHHFRNDNRFQILTKKPVLPSESEINKNKRSRSAKLRVAQLK